MSISTYIYQTIHVVLPNELTCSFSTHSNCTKSGCLSYSFPLSLHFHSCSRYIMAPLAASDPCLPSAAAISASTSDANGQLMPHLVRG